MTDAPAPPPGAPAAPAPAVPPGAPTVWYPPAPKPAPFAEGQGVPYHRLLRAQPGYRWWKPLLALGVAALYVLVASLLLTVVLLVVGVAIGAVPFDVDEGLVAFQAWVTGLTEPDIADPFQFVFLVLSVAIWLPCVPLAMLTVGLRPVGFVHSVVGRLRARVLAPFLALSLLVGGLIMLSVLVPAWIAGEPIEVTTPGGTLAVLVVLVVLLTPFQAAAEEYVFRGLLFQIFGSWLRWMPLAVVVPTGLFIAGHSYDWWGLADVGLFGLAACYLVWRTGGLEAGIAWHSVNNIVSFLILASGISGTTSLQSSTGAGVGEHLISLGLSVLTTGVFLGGAELIVRRTRLVRTRPYVAPPAPVPWAWGPRGWEPAPWLVPGAEGAATAAAGSEAYGTPDDGAGPGAPRPLG
ncbi:MAG: CPBP family intramembrane metalloprotease [Actinomycetales bacterium]|nr:CPBP family intramembrane metalloprotease [Actinomycetales bacterium]